MKDTRRGSPRIATRRCALIEERRPSLVILDIWLQGSKLDGLEVLARIKKQHPELPVVIISGHGNIETAVMAIKRGAYDYIEKPFKADRLVVVTMRALEASKLRRENKELKEKKLLQLGPHRQIARHEPFAPEHSEGGANEQPRDDHGAARVRQGACRPLSSPCSQRENGPFVAVNAASMAADRVEIEFFGVEETGQRRAKWALSRKPITAHFTSTRLRTCLSIRRASSCACSSSRSSSASAAAQGFRSTCASSRPQAGISSAR